MIHFDPVFVAILLIAVIHAGVVLTLIKGRKKEDRIME
jgi:hypothetical protein